MSTFNFGSGNTISGRTKFVLFTSYNNGVTNVAANLSQSYTTLGTYNHTYTLANFSGTGYDYTKLANIYLRCFINSANMSAGGAGTWNNINIITPTGFGSTGAADYTFFFARYSQEAHPISSEASYISDTIIIPLNSIDTSIVYDMYNNTGGSLVATRFIGATQYE